MKDQNKKSALGRVTCGNKQISISQIVEIAHKKSKLILNKDASFKQNFEQGAAFLNEQISLGQDIYGITTGYGDSCLRPVSSNLSEELPINLSNFHGCGMGNYFDPISTRAIWACRLVSLSTGFSGIRFTLLEELEFFLQNNILPLIPEEGSVGASGDLTPLSYIARAIAGCEKVLYKNQILPSAEVLKKLNRKPYRLTARETLAIMNGTSVMTALACLAYERAAYLVKLASRITAMNSISLLGNPKHFDPDLFAVKPHPGQSQVANWIREDLQSVSSKNNSRLQDRYSIRCAPHVIGVLQDALLLFKNMVEIELNSANDNPIVHSTKKKILHGGHFYGGHIAFAMDSIKNAVANIADLLDRQSALLVDEKFNNGMPPNLSGSEKSKQSINHGLKALQIANSAWTAEALKNTMPASVFSRSTECHNQDKVSMGTIAARDCLRVLQLTEQVAAGTMLASIQALELRIKQNELTTKQLRPGIAELFKDVRKVSKFLLTDRPLEEELRILVCKIQMQEWQLYSEE